LGGRVDRINRRIEVSFQRRADNVACVVINQLLDISEFGGHTPGDGRDLGIYRNHDEFGHMNPRVDND
jgi:hypothetical protein